MRVIEFTLRDGSPSNVARFQHILESFLAEYSSYETSEERMAYLRRMLDMPQEERSRMIRETVLRAMREFNRTQ